MKDIKMIILDLDETLLRTEKYISEYTISILKKCQLQGIKIVFATARSIQKAQKYFNQFVPNIFIGYGGALAIEGEKIIYRFDISADISFQLINRCLKENEILNVFAINESVAHGDKLDSDFPHYQRIDFSQNNNISYLKILVITNNSRIVENIASEYPELDLVGYTGENLYSFTNKNAVKWKAIKAVSSYYNISTDKFVAFGDDRNDFEMIKNCGIGIAMGNAINEVKAVADYICDTNDNDGVAKWLVENVID